jgi:RES domain-containing protein
MIGTSQVGKNWNITFKKNIYLFTSHRIMQETARKSQGRGHKVKKCWIYACYAKKPRIYKRSQTF